MIRFFLLSFLFLLLAPVSAQELNCQVGVNSNPALNLSTTDREILKEIEQAVTDLMNETSWTSERYEVEERINCNISISITEIKGGDNYRATMQIQATRPVFNTTYNTTLINFLDEEVHFNFKRGAKIIYSDNMYTDNLSSILAFYAYYILGLDADSFVMKGGSTYLKKAQSVVMLAQSSGDPGWKSNTRGKRNRYWLIDNSLHELFVPLRDCFYEYHRKGLDRMFDNETEAREEIKKALEKLVSVHTSRPNSENILNFVRSKRDEIKGIYKDADKKQQTVVVNTLKRIDPTNSSIYQEIIQ